MPSSFGKLNRCIGPATPVGETTVPSFEYTGDCVIHRILRPIRERLPLLPCRSSDHVEAMGTVLRAGSVFSGRQNAAEDSKHYPVEVEIKVVSLKFC